jgi:hypothetical protein
VDPSAVIFPAAPDRASSSPPLAENTTCTVLGEQFEPWQRATARRSLDFDPP